MKTEKPKSGHNGLLGCLGIIFLFVAIPAAIYGIILATEYLEGQSRTRPIPGDVAKYDPITSYPQIVQYAGGSNLHLLNIDMTYVKADGTLDLTADYGAKVDYSFDNTLDTTPTNAAPLGAGGGPGGTSTERITIHLEKPGMKTFTKGTNYYNYGILRSTTSDSPWSGRIVPSPNCPLKQLWDAAIQKDAPPNAVATINYGSDGYSFSIKDTKIRLQFDANCQLKH